MARFLGRGSGSAGSGGSSSKTSSPAPAILRAGGATEPVQAVIVREGFVIRDADNKVRRPDLTPRPPYGLRLQPRDTEKWVEHWPAELGAGLADLLDVLTPNQTTIIDLRLTRVVREGVFRFTRSLAARDFRKDPAGGAV